VHYSVAGSSSANVLKVFALSLVARKEEDMAGTKITAKERETSRISSLQSRSVANSPHEVDSQQTETTTVKFFWSWSYWAGYLLSRKFQAL